MQRRRISLSSFDGSAALADTLTAEGATDEDKRIKFQSDIADYNNERKLYEGGFLRLIRAHVVEDRQAEEAKMADVDRRRPEAPTALRHDAAGPQNALRDDERRRRSVTRSCGVFRIRSRARSMARWSPPRQPRKWAEPLSDQQKARSPQSLGDRDPFFEREMIKFFLREFDALPADQRFEAYDKNLPERPARRGVMPRRRMRRVSPTAILQT